CLDALASGSREDDGLNPHRFIFSCNVSFLSLPSSSSPTAPTPPSGASSPPGNLATFVPRQTMISLSPLSAKRTTLASAASSQPVSHCGYELPRHTICPSW